MWLRAITTVTLSVMAHRIEFNQFSTLAGHTQTLSAKQGYSTGMHVCVSDMWGFCSSQYEDYGTLGCDTVVPVFQMNPTVSIIRLPWRWRHCTSNIHSILVDWSTVQLKNKFVVSLVWKKGIINVC
jgi:hypothetical protein